MSREVLSEVEVEEDGEVDGEDTISQVGEKIDKGKKPLKKPAGKACEWRVCCQFNKKTEQWKITKAELSHTCPGHVHKWRGPTSRALWLAQVIGNKVTIEYNGPIGFLCNEFCHDYHWEAGYLPMRAICQHIISSCQAESFSHIPTLLERFQ
ncbi:hypothetical protein R1flu_003708 [Riccia fluitans]|uniref:Uncharacterized protein n=1 Tax=Riccia fluitans TaxID=41844 RepID=A0ABD1Y9S5_9MARC